MSPEERAANLMAVLAEYVAGLPDEELLADARAAGVDVGATTVPLRNLLLATARRGSARAVVLSSGDARLVTDALRREATEIRTACAKPISGGALKLDQDAARRLVDSVAVRAHELDRLAAELAGGILLVIRTTP